MNRPICIIDDDEDVRAVMCFALEFESIKTLPMDNAVHALEYLIQLSEEQYPALIIVDYMMPEMTGLKFIEIVRTKYADTLGKIPVALSTARIADETDNIPDGVILLEKPINLPTLLYMVKTYYQKPAGSCSLL